MNQLNKIHSFIINVNTAKSRGQLGEAKHSKVWKTSIVYSSVSVSFSVTEQNVELLFVYENGSCVKKYSHFASYFYSW